MLPEISYFLAGLSVFVLVLTIAIAIQLKTPDGYQEIDCYVVENNTIRLLWITVAISTVEIGWIAYQVIKYGFAWNQLVYSLGWSVVLFGSSTIYSIPYQGGLYGMFLGILLLESSMAICVTEVVPLSAGLLLWVLVGSWYHEQIENVSQEYTSSVFSQITFRWLNPVIDAGTAKHLEWQDLCDLLKEDTTEAVLKKYHSMPSTLSIKQRAIRLIARYTLFQHSFAVVYTLFTLAGPLYIYKLISMLQSTDTVRWDLWPMVLGFFGFSFAKAFLEPQMVSAGSRAGTQMRSLFLQLIYDKSLTSVLSTSGANASVGKVVTLMTVDTEMFRRFLQNAYIGLIQIPLSLVISVTILFYILGVSALVAIAIVLLFFPITGYLGQNIAKLQKKLLSRSGKRVSLVNELILGIRIIKYLAWESFFEQRITEARKKEIKSVIKLFMIYIAFSVVGEGSGVIISFSTFAIYSLVTGKTLDPATAFTALNLFKIVSENLRKVPNQIKLFLNYQISIDRIIHYLEEEDKEPNCQLEHDDTIGFESAHLGYHGTTEVEHGNVFELKEIDLSIPVKKMTLICGPTGAGKTTFLLGLLGELQLHYGKVHFPNLSSAFSSQSAWIMNATIKENILFGSEYDEERYLKVLQACALLPDLQSIPGGDMTEIGEKGINLSGKYF
jgi:ABC-type multidrug transport system fused ATPase/permease subunit